MRAWYIQPSLSVRRSMEQVGPTDYSRAHMRYALGYHYIALSIAEFCPANGCEGGSHYQYHGQLACPLFGIARIRSDLGPSAPGEKYLFRTVIKRRIARKARCCLLQRRPSSLCGDAFDIWRKARGVPKIAGFLHTDGMSALAGSVGALAIIFIAASFSL